MITHETRMSKVTNVQSYAKAYLKDVLVTPFVLIAALSAGIFLRVNGLDEQSLNYFDEAAYVLEGAHIAGEEPSVSQYYARPGYVALIGAARYLWDDALSSARLVSLLSFVASVATMWILLPRLYGKEVRNYACLLFSVIPLDVYYSRLIFPDSLSAFLMLLSGLTFILAVSRDGKQKPEDRDYYQPVRTKWLIVSALSMGYFLTVGSYRVVPIVSAIGIFYLVTIIRCYKSDKLVLAKAALAVGIGSAPILIYQIKYSFINQMLTLAFLFPREGRTSSLNIDLLYYPYVLYYYFLPFIVMVALSVGFLFIKSKKFKHALSVSLHDPKIQLLIVAASAPALFHTFYALRGVKVISPSLPWMVILSSIILTTISVALIRSLVLLASMIYFALHSQNLSSAIGERGLQSFADSVGQYHGVISDKGGGWMLAASSKTLNPSRTRIAPYWQCDWDKTVCNADYKILSVTEFDAMDAQAKENHEVISEFETVLEKEGAHLATLELAALPPGSRLAMSKLPKGPYVSRWVLVRNRSLKGE